MDADQVGLLREALAHTGWWSRARTLGEAVRRTRSPGGLMLVGTPEVEPWHLTAHLDDEARYSGLAQLRPTLVRWSPPLDAPPHLAIGLERLKAASRGETVFVVSPGAAPDALLERVDDARRIGATVLSLDGGDPALEALAHERMTISPSGLLVPADITRELGPTAQDILDDDLFGSFDVAQHLVSAAAGEVEPTGRSWRSRLATVLDRFSGPMPES